MPAPTFIQARPSDSTTYVTGDNTSEDVSGTSGSFDASISANSTLIAFVGQVASGIRTHSVADSSDSYATDWTEAAGTYDGGAATRQSRIFYRTGFGAGAVTVRIKSTVAEVKDVVLVEISESTFDVGSSFAGASTDVDGTNGYPCSASTTVIDTAADVFVISGVTLIANAGTLNDGTNYTQLAEDSTAKRIHVQYRTSATALTDERGWVAEAGTNRDFAGVIASFEAVASGLSIPVASYHYNHNIGSNQ